MTHLVSHSTPRVNSVFRDALDSVTVLTALIQAVETAESEVRHLAATSLKRGVNEIHSAASVVDLSLTDR